MPVSIYERLRVGDFVAEPPLDDFEAMVLNALIASDDPASLARNNKDVASELNVSRNAVARARRRIAHKIDIIKPGF